MRTHRLTPLRAILVVVVALMAQIGFTADLRIVGAVGDLLLLVTVAAALSGGPDRGATYGFAAGVAFDLVLDSPFGLSALTYTVIGYGLGVVATAVLRPTGWWPVAFAAGAAPAAVALYTGVGHLIGAPYPWADLPRIAVAVGLWNAALVMPMLAVLRWVHGRGEPDRLAVGLP